MCGILISGAKLVDLSSKRPLSTRLPMAIVTKQVLQYPFFGFPLKMFNKLSRKQQKGDACKPPTNTKCRLRSYHVEWTPSRPIWHVKQRRDWLVPGSETSWESQLLQAFCFFCVWNYIENDSNLCFFCQFELHSEDSERNRRRFELLMR